jgi:8-oxo-dGDP phosphatase
MSDYDYPVVESQLIFRGRVITLRTDEVRMSDGSLSRREVVRHPGAVAIVALDDDDNVVLVRQYRHPVGAYLLELPAGLLDVEGEPALDAARRELYEEAALTAHDWHVLLDLYPSPGMSDEAIRVYLARGLAAVAERFVPEHEEITLTVSRLPLADAIELALDGRLANASAVAGVLAASVARAQGWRQLRAADTPWPARPGH